jgi:hypothetical protein
MLTATTLPKDEKDEKDEGQTVITNARILRSGVEIFAFVEWTQKDATSSRLITGLVRQSDDPQKKDAAAPNSPDRPHSPAAKIGD